MKLSLQNLAITYGKKVILEDISAPQIPEGSLVGVLGANGVGKSSLLRAIAGLQKLQGEVIADDTPLSNLTSRARSELISYLPQTLPQATSLTAYEAVISAIRAIEDRLPTKMVEQLTEDVFTRLNIRHLAFQTLASMSGGQRQLVGLAQVIARRPSLLLLDEPTSALDLKWQLSVFDVVRSVLKDRRGVCLMAIHDINLAMRQCDYILLLAKGRLLAFGPPEEAMTSERLEQAYDISGRVEYCSQGTPFVIADAMAIPLTPPSS